MYMEAAQGLVWAEMSISLSSAPCGGKGECSARGAWADTHYWVPDPLGTYPPGCVAPQVYTPLGTLPPRYLGT